MGEFGRVLAGELEAVVGLAIRNPTRTQQEHIALVVVAKRVDERLAHEAAETWRFEPCQRCSLPTEIGAGVCPEGCFDDEAELTRRDVAGGRV